MAEKQTSNLDEESKRLHQELDTLELTSLFRQYRQMKEDGTGLFAEEEELEEPEEA